MNEFQNKISEENQERTDGEISEWIQKKKLGKNFKTNPEIIPSKISEEIPRGNPGGIPAGIIEGNPGGSYKEMKGFLVESLEESL